MPSFVVLTPLALFGKRIDYIFLRLVPLHTSENSRPRLVICQRRRALYMKYDNKKTMLC